MASLPTLIKIGSGLWIGMWGTYFAITERMQYKFRHAQFVTESMRVFDGYPHKETLMGGNIKQLRFHLGDAFTKKKNPFAQIVIPICGSKTKGKLYSWSSLQHVDEENETETWRVDRLDLMIHEKDPFTIYKHPDADYVKDIVLPESELYRDR